MGRSLVTSLPSLQRRMTALGENLRLARRRRKLTMEQIAERAGITRQTLRAIERGDPAVSFGHYANVLFCLGLDKDLDLIARDDELGRKLQDVALMPPRQARQQNSKTLLKSAKADIS